MLTKKQVSEIKEHLDKAQNPLFFFDNDQDGLCSYLLLRRYLERGKGVAVKTSPMNKDYLRKVDELNADYVFVLDVPNVKNVFFKGLLERNIPIVWIDHHENNLNEIPDFVNYYNPLYNRSKSNEPVTELCYQISGKKEDIWIAVLGNISDRFIPKYYSEFKKNFSDLSLDSEDAAEIYYSSGIGNVSQILGAFLKDKTSNVVRGLNFLVKVKSPYEILNQNEKNYFMHERFNEINSKYKKFLSKAKEIGKKSGKVLFFEYAGDTSMSADIANGLKYLFKDKLIVVAYLKGARINISVRGDKVKDILLESVKNLENSVAGGHENAAGAQISKEDFEKFKENFLANAS